MEGLINNLTIETSKKQEEATECLKTALQMEIDGDGEGEGEGKGEGQRGRG